MTEGNVVTIGNFLGTHIKVNKPELHIPRKGKYLRVRTALDISKPLKTGFFLPRGGKESIWIQFKFERLGDFCYRCGCLDHGESSCSKNDVNIEDVIDLRKAYGPWLRVSSASQVVTEKDARSGLTDTIEIQEHVSTTHA